MERITSVTSSSTSVKPPPEVKPPPRAKRLPDDDARGADLRIECLSGRVLDYRRPINQVRNSRLFAAQHEAREHCVRRRGGARRQAERYVQHAARGVGRRAERIDRNLALRAAHVAEKLRVIEDL